MWLAVGLWLVIVGWSLALMRAAGTPEDLPRLGVPEPERTPDRPLVLGARRRRALVIGQSVLLALVVVAAVVASDAEQWEQADLVGLLAVLVVGSDFMTLEAKRFRISGSFLGLVLAMALLGPAPAAAMGVASQLTDALRSRTRGIMLLNNLATYATFPLLGALVLEWIQDSGATPGGGYAVAVFGVFIAANALNFAMIAGHNVLLRGGSLTTLFRTVYLPVLPWELATASLTAMAVYGFEVYGAGIIGLFALALGVYQLLLRALLEGQMHSE